MQSETHDIAVVIGAYTAQRWAELKRAIESVRTQTLAAHEIVVVIAHNPRLAARARHAWPDVIVSGE